MMIRLIALVLSIILQLLAAIFALRLMRVTKYRVSWVLISAGFTLLAIKRAIKLIQFLQDDYSFYFRMADDWLSVLISIFFLGGVVFIGEIFYALKRSEIERNRSEKRLLNAIIQTEEKEKKRFAKDLHDGLGPLLSTVKMMISSLINTDSDNKNKEILQNTSLVINEAISSIKEISNNLSPHVLSNFGLISAIKGFAGKVNEAKSINIQLSGNLKESERFDHHAELILYRSVCELINNTIKHAAAKNIYIDITKYIKTITIHYTDDGIGFDSENQTNEHHGMGMSNISSRVKTLNGVFVLNSVPGEGVSALIKIRLK
jgi:signal transduction histidine kinase